MVLMSSAGHIYQQPMDNDSSATGGPFYLTNILPVQHSDLEDTNGQVAGGGVSVYYSHTLQIMLFSFTQGKFFKLLIFTIMGIMLFNHNSVLFDSHVIMNVIESD